MSLGQNQNSYYTLLVEWYSFFNPLYVGARVPCLQVPTLALHKILVLACIAQHILAELGGNLAICQWEERQSVSHTDVVCATSCFGKIRDSCMHALLTLMLGQGIKWSTLSSQCESQSALGGRSSFRLVNPNSSKPFKAQSLVLRSSPSDRTS